MTLDTLLFLGDQDVRTLLDADDLLDALAQGFVALSQGRTVAPDRGDLRIPGSGVLLMMPAWQLGRRIAVKMVGIFPGHEDSSGHGHPALIALFDPDTGTPVAILDGRHLTTMRTAGAAALSARHLARAESPSLAIIGAGVQGRAHLDAMTRIRDFADIRIASSSRKSAEQLAASHPAARAVLTSHEAVRDAGLVCLCTNSGTPVIQWDWIAPGTHLTSVGYAAPGGELPPEATRRARLFVETRRAFEPAPVGCAELAGLSPDTGTELGEVIAGSRPGRQTAQEITLYKSMGHAMEDMVVANLVYGKAMQRGTGQVIAL